MNGIPEEIVRCFGEKEGLHRGVYIRSIMDILKLDEMRLEKKMSAHYLLKA